MNNLGIHFTRGGGRGDDDTEIPDSSDTDTGDDTSDDDTRHTDDDTVVHPIYTDPISVIYLHERLSGIFAEKVHGRYYLGVAAYTDEDGPVLDIALSATTFLRFPFADAFSYVKAYCSVTHIIPQYVPRIDILQVIIVRGVYSVVVKTTWLRAIQNKWKKYRLSRRD